jgi:hypothetical protein
MNTNGTYTFTPTKPGVYEYEVPVCKPGQTPVSSCETETLTITVTDPNSLNNPPVANTDIANTLESTPVTLNTLSNDKPGNIGALLDPGTVKVISNPAH